MLTHASVAWLWTVREPVCGPCSFTESPAKGRALQSVQAKNLSRAAFAAVGHSGCFDPNNANESFGLGCHAERPVSLASEPRFMAANDLVVHPRWLQAGPLGLE